ncbi:MBL fold metallo-hydrolase [candidate division KSB1 bacterium]|nr:MBL fold metallo-hydrolase [candidate division KSB1 bacterium]
MKISFYGGVETVTGSMHMIHVNDKRILLDCGLFQGRRKEAEKKNRKLPFDEKSLDAMILSHAHIDHSGNIPNLVRNGFKGPIYTTHASKDLCEYMLADSGYIQEKDVEYVNKKNAKKNLPPVEPIYTKQDAMDSLSYFEGVDYNKEFDVTEGVRAEFYDAGHVLGSALTKITLTENGRTVKLGYIVDLGRKNLPILRDPVIIPDLDYIIIESTYGGKFHERIEEAEEQLHKIIRRAVSRNGKVIIPSFALERTQEIVYCLNNLWNKNKLPRIPVFVDSPLAVNVTSVFKTHEECFDEATRKVLEYDEDPFGFEKLTYVRDVEKSKEINNLKQPCIIISASGMCENGRILHHLKNNIQDSRTIILIVGFMAQNTLGRKLVDKLPVVKIFGEEYNLNAEVEVMNAFSAHADHNDLMNYAMKANQKLKGIFLVHGEEKRTKAAADGMRKLGIQNVRAPRLGEKVEL